SAQDFARGTSSIISRRSDLSKTNSDGFRINLFSQGIELLAWEKALDVFEQLVFLAADVRTQECGEFAEQRGGRLNAQAADQRFELAMLGDQPRDERVIRNRGKQNRLLDFEMVRQFELVAIDGVARKLCDVRRR